MTGLLDLLMNLLSEFGLPEPDVNRSVSLAGQSVHFLLSWPDRKLGIRQGQTSSSLAIDEWIIWECHDEISGRAALRAIADRMKVEPNVLRLDFSRIKGLLDARQYEAAKDALEQLESQIQRDHPDWATCGQYRRDIRIAVRAARPADTPEQQQRIEPSFPVQLRKDAERVVPPKGPDFNVMGFFSPEDETLSAVDAVWMAQVRDGKTSIWTVCLQGNPAYESDPNWDTCGTEVEVLDGLLSRFEGQMTFVWGSLRMLTLLRNWHYRAKGIKLPDIEILDLESLAQVAFPMAHRTDFPDSLCKQLKVEFCDAMGLGGPLAAVLVLMDKISAELKSFSQEHSAALRSVLSFAPKSKRGDSSDGQPVAASKTPVPSVWLDFFVSSSPAEALDGYIHLLRKHFQKLPGMVQKSEGKRADSKCTVMDFLKKGGLLMQAANFDYLERAEQIGFSQRVDECLADARPYVLEAGTGIGKTIGYLVPALLSGKRTFISTHTKSLQDQAWAKDVPLVLKAFSLAGIERTVTIIKGKGNYVCLQTVADMLEAMEEYVEKTDDCFFLAALMNWLLATKTGWLSEIEHLGHWHMLSQLGRDQAPPKLRDEWADIDPHARARDSSTKTDLVLVNHSYVFALAKSGEADKNNVKTLILDEAHNVDSIITEVLTLHFFPWKLLHELQSVLKRDSTGKSQGLYRVLLTHPQRSENKHLSSFSDLLEKYEKQLTAWCSDARKRLNIMFSRGQDVDPDYPAAFDLSEFWVESLYESAKDLNNTMSFLANSAHDFLENIAAIKGLPRRLAGSLGSLEEHLNDNIQALNSLFEKKEDWVHWGEARVKTDSYGLTVKDDDLISWEVDLHKTPLNIADWLRQHINTLYEHRAYVSATLSIGGSFESICERLGLSTEEEKHKPILGIYPSPFDYRKQALLAVPHDIPVANPALKIDPLYIEEQSKHIASQAIASEGRMLVLFTSNLIMREMAPRLQARLRGHGIIVLMQTDASRAALVDRLRDAPRKGEKIVLLGVKSFWEGIDVQGEALSVLVVSRLPFEYHFHPVARAKQHFYESKGHDRDYFQECVVPMVFLHLRQMYGRLIRSEKDRGATVITDPRIYIRRYGKALLQSLPETTTVIDKGPIVVEAVRRFLRGETVVSSHVWGGLPTASYELSPEQRAVVECPSKRVLVRAAAGSGKTHVLITRLIHFVETGNAKPDEILALTFTNKAMEVMYERIETVLGGEKAYKMHRNVLTYHKLAMRIIRQNDKDQGTETGFIDEKNPQLRDELFTLARKEAGLTSTTLNDEDALTLIAYAQNGLVNEAEIESAIPEWEKTKPLMAKFARFFLAYVKILRDRNLIDYGEAIVGAVRILRKDKEQAQRWTNRFKWIFCDEYQDSSPAQATLLQLLGQQANVFVVGDSNQSIYSWQGADPNNLERFELDFPNTASFNLSKNYRCFPKLVRMSAGFLERAGETRGIRVEYDQKRSTEDQSVYFFHNEDDEKESVALASIAKMGLALEIPGDPPKKATVGILARKWHLLKAVEIELIRQGIPYRFEGETARGIVASQRVKDLVQRAADLVSRSSAGKEFGDTAEGQLGQALSQGQFTTADQLLRAIRKVLPGTDLSGNDAKDFDSLCAILHKQPPDLLSCFLSSDKTDTRVVLSTVHSQKGEEFDTVIVIGLEEGNSPHEHPTAFEGLLEWRKIIQTYSHATWRAPMTDVDLKRLYEQEEKRIFYVAMTRARYNLVVSSAKNRKVFGRHRQYQQSSFLALANDPKLVRETNDSVVLTLTGPTPHKAEAEGYRSDGRVYETTTGACVRSKSEMLLANEFTRRGMYYEYEEPPDNTMNALPDFTFPDYGNVVLEHLGMLSDPQYLERWTKKAAEYEAQGIRYFLTNEEEIMSLSVTVDRLQSQFALWAEKQFDLGRVHLIKRVEDIRQDCHLNIGRAIGGFVDGVFEASDNENPKVVAVDLSFALGLPEKDESEINLPGCSKVVWNKMRVGSLELRIASSQG